MACGKRKAKDGMAKKHAIQSNLYLCVRRSFPAGAWPPQGQAPGLPKTGKGDGINHYAGGGTNYNTGANLFAYAGTASTDTTNPNTIRFGALVGTFSAAPVNNVDWFFIGTQNSILVPQGGGTLYLADNDDPAKNGGGFTVNVAPAAVPEASSVVSFSLLMAFGLGGLVVAARRKKAHA